MATAQVPTVHDVRTVAEFRKTHNETVRAELYRYGAQPCAQVRTFAMTNDGPKPTTRGLALSVAKLPELRAAVEALEAEARASGMLDETRA